MPDIPATALGLSLLGSPRLALDGVDVSGRVKYRKSWALWALLGTTQGQTHDRAVLSEWLWPDHSPPSARANLRQVIADLRGLLESAGLRHAFQASVQTVGLSPDERLAVDAERLQRWAKACARAHDQDWGALPEDGVLEVLSDGGFLQGFDLPPMPDGTDWLRYMRDTCADAWLQILEFKARRAAAQGRLHDAVATARRLLALAPARESHAVMLANLLHQQGQLHEAQQVLHRSMGAFEEQLGLKSLVLDELMSPVDAASPWSFRSPIPEWRRVTGVYSDVPQGLHTDEQAIQAWTRIWQGMVLRAGGLAIEVPGLAWAAVFGLDPARGEPARRACEMVRQWISLGLTDQVRAGLADARVLVRPGLSAGLMVGDAMQAAMRACWQAGWRQWLATQGVVLAARATDFTRCDDEQDTGLWCATLREHLPAEPPDDLPLVGREHELQWLVSRWEEALTAGASAVLIRAPAGYGKSLVMRELAQQVMGQGGHVLRVTCGQHIQEHPMMPWRIALADAEPQSTRRGADDRQVLRARVLRKIRQLCAERPLLINLEDVHWADKATLDHLPVLLEQLVGSPVMLVMSSRPVPDQDWPAQVQVLELGALTEDASHRLVLDMNEATHLDVGERSRLVRLAGGVPLILQWLARSRMAVAPAHAGIQALVQEQLDALGPGRVVLRAAAVLGERFDVASLQALLPMHAVRTVLARAADLHLIRRVAPDECAFGHALVQEVVYDGIALPQRQAWHAQAAGHLQHAEQVAADQVARHWEAAQSWDEAAQWWRHAGDAAIKRDFAADALVCYERALAALAHLEDGDDREIQRLSLQIQVGHCLHMTEGFGSAAAWQRFGHVMEALTRQTQVDPQRHDLRFAALAGRYMGSSSQGEVGGLDLARQLLGMAETTEQSLMARYAMGNSLFWLGRLEEARQALEEAVRLSDQVSPHRRLLYCSDDPALVCRAFLAWLCWLEGDDQGLSRRATELQQRLTERARPHTVCFALTLLSCAHWCQGEWALLQSGASRVHELSGQFRFPLWAGVSSLLLLCCQARQGQMGDTDALHAAAHQMRGAYQAGITTSRWMVASALMAQGLHEQALPLLEQACREAMHHEDQYCVPQMQMLLARCHQRTGDPTLAQTLALEAREAARHMGAQGLLRLWDQAASVSD